MIHVLALLLALSAHARAKEALPYESQGGKLTIRTDKGVREYTSNLADDGSHDEVLVTDFQRQARVVVVEHHGYEEWSYDLVSLANNDRISVSEKPVWRGTAFAGSAESTGFEEPGTLFLGFCDAKGCWQVYSDAGKFGKVKWVADDTLEVRKEMQLLRCKLDRSKQQASCEKKK